jgi:hypothetical protein
MPDHFYLSPWGVHPGRPRAGTDAQTLMEQWWTRVARIFPRRGAPGRAPRTAAGGGAGDSRAGGAEGPWH